LTTQNLGDFVPFQDSTYKFSQYDSLTAVVAVVAQISRPHHVSSACAAPLFAHTCFSTPWRSSRTMTPRTTASSPRAAR